MKVLIIEDMPDQAFFLSKLLGRLGVVCDIKYDPIEAIEYVLTVNVDVIITDLAMPIMDGFELISRVREFSMIPIIVITGIIDGVSKYECLKRGANYFMTKPIFMGDLYSIFNELKFKN